MTHIRFQEIKIRGVHRWTENGKRRQETKVFMQTINPFNKGADGLPKTQEQIVSELRSEREAWLKGGVMADERFEKGLRRLADDLFAQQGRTEYYTTLKTDLLPLLEAAQKLRVIKFVSNGDGDWTAIARHSLDTLRKELTKWQR